MNVDAFETSATGSISGHRLNGIRNPANVKVGPHRRRTVALAMPTAPYLEALGLALLITAVASALPLVMMLRQ